MILKSYIYLINIYLKTKEPKIQDLEAAAKNESCSLKILKFARIQYLLFGSVLLSRFKQ
jgi:hypothetical protein